MHIVLKRSAFAIFALTCAVSATAASAAVCTDTACDKAQLGSNASIKLASADAPLSLTKFAKKKNPTATAVSAVKKASAARTKTTKGVIARGLLKSRKALIAYDAPLIPSADQLPPQVADANAALGNGLPSEQINQPIESVNGVQVAAADQLNDIDRALSETPPVAEPPVATVSDTPVAQPTPAVTAPRIQASAQTVGRSYVNTDSTWDQTSLVGKLFLAFGALLTIGSVARMFLA